MERDREENMKGLSYIYLEIIGVAEEHQGKGFGGKLIRPLLKKIILPELNLPIWEMKR